MKNIPLTQDQFAIVDDDDFERIGHWRWTAIWNPVMQRFYATKAFISPDGRKKVTYLHRLVMQEPQGSVDHKNHDTLDCRKQNLRICTASQNQANRIAAQKNSTTGIPGVTWNKTAKRWNSKIKVDGKLIQLGSFIDKDTAILRRRNAMLKYFGEFANLSLYPDHRCHDTAPRPKSTWGHTLPAARVSAQSHEQTIASASLDPAANRVLPFEGCEITGLSCSGLEAD